MNILTVPVDISLYSLEAGSFLFMIPGTSYRNGLQCLLEVFSISSMYLLVYKVVFAATEQILLGTNPVQKWVTLYVRHLQCSACILPSKLKQTTDYYIVLCNNFTIV